MNFNDKITSMNRIEFYVFIDNNLRCVYHLNKHGLKEFVLTSSSDSGVEMKCSDLSQNSLSVSFNNRIFYSREVSIFDNEKHTPHTMLCIPLHILVLKPLVRELEGSEYYRKCVYCNIRKVLLLGQSMCQEPLGFKGVILEMFSKDTYKIDYAWGLRLWRQIRMSIERDCAAAWLSTLGGAFSALGEQSNGFAMMALKTSLRQIKLSVDSGDPDGVARGWLFLALALSQLGHGRAAFHLLNMAYSTPSYDIRYRKMCMGVEAKLKYDAKVRQQQKSRGLLEKPESLEKVLKSMLGRNMS